MAFLQSQACLGSLLQNRLDRQATGRLTQNAVATRAGYVFAFHDEEEIGPRCLPGSRGTARSLQPPNRSFDRTAELAITVQSRFEQDDFHAGGRQLRAVRRSGWGGNGRVNPRSLRNQFRSTGRSQGVAAAIREPGAIDAQPARDVREIERYRTAVVAAQCIATYCRRLSNSFGDIRPN
jgi:hypothetical protein